MVHVLHSVSMAIRSTNRIWLSVFFLWIGMFSEFGTHRYVLNSHRQKLQMIDIWILFWCGKKIWRETKPIHSNQQQRRSWNLTFPFTNSCNYNAAPQTHRHTVGGMGIKKEKENIYFSGEGKKTKEMSKLKFAHTKYPQQYHKHHPTTDKNNNYQTVNEKL